MSALERLTLPGGATAERIGLYTPVLRPFSVRFPSVLCPLSVLSPSSLGSCQVRRRVTAIHHKIPIGRAEPFRAGRSLPVRNWAHQSALCRLGAERRGSGQPGRGSTHQDAHRSHVSGRPPAAKMSAKNHRRVSFSRAFSLINSVISVH